MSHMGKEMEKFFVGPMPAQEFLDTFFPMDKLRKRGERGHRFSPGCFQETVSAECERDAYDPFVRLNIFSRHCYSSCVADQNRHKLHTWLEV